MEGIIIAICFEALFIILGTIILFNLFKYEPKDGAELYSNVIANRGLHIFYPENSLSAFKYAVEAGLGINIDVRQTRDGRLICFKDTYTRKLLSIPGKISMYDYATIKRCRLGNTKERVVLLSKALKTIDGKVPVILEIKGRVNKQYIIALGRALIDCKGKVYFRTKNLRVYKLLSKRYKYTDEKRVYFVLNLFRKRLPFITGKDYNFQRDKYYGLSKLSKIDLPTVEDISSIIVRNMEELESKKEILATIGKVINRYETRIGEDHWVKKSLWLHRSIVSSKYPEHSKESFEECIKFANKHQVKLTLEFDVVLYKDDVKCYHTDKISSVLGQSASCAEKIDIEKTLSLTDILNMVSDYPNINLAIDIKDSHLKNRELEQLIIEKIEGSNYNGNLIIMSFNPMVLNFFKKVRPDWLRAQVSHSLRGLAERVPFFKFPWVINGVLGTLFDLSEADCVVMDNSNWLYYLISFHKNVQGKPVLIYAPKSYTEQEAFIGRESVANFIVENIESTEDWPRSYIAKFR